MERVAVTLFMAWILGCVTATGLEVRHCPADYRRRVETCIMEAQLAPQAGGGITLVLKKDTIVDLCDRGFLQKTQDCLAEVHERCANNVTVVQELDRLYSVTLWQQGGQVLCTHSHLIHDNQDCMLESASSVTSCVLICTHIFRMGLSFATPGDHDTIRQVTCNFAESVVKCVQSPLESRCPPQMVTSIAEAMRLFLPPYCRNDPHNTITTSDTGTKTASPTTTNANNITTTTTTTTQLSSGEHVTEQREQTP